MINRSLGFLLFPALLGVVAATVAVFVWHTSFKRYASEGTLPIEADITEYKRFADVLSSRETVQAFATARSLPEDVTSRMRSQVETPAAYKQAFVPVIRMSKNDLKDLAEAPRDPKCSGDTRALRRDEARQCSLVQVALRVSQSHETPEGAQTAVRHLADYIGWALVRSDIQARIDEMRQHALSEQVSKSQRLAMKSIDLERYEEYAKGIAALAERFPQPKGAAEAQQKLLAIDVPPKFQSLSAQIVGAEVDLLATRTEAAELRRHLQIAHATIAFCDRADKILRTGFSDPKRAFEDVRKALPQSSGADGVAAMAARTTIEGQIAEAERRFGDLRFVSGPSLPTHPSGPGRLRIAALAFAFGFMLALAFLYRNALVGFARRQLAPE